jgi:ADP-ribose pyrophosphatase
MRRAKRLAGDLVDELTESKERYLALLQARPALAKNLPGGIEIVADPDEIGRIEAAMARRFEAKGLPRAWAQAGLFYEDPYLAVLRDAVIFPDGKPGLYHRAIAHHNGPTGVAILARYRGDFILLRHFRHPSRTWHLEIPRGAVGVGEKPEHMVQVEISEEIGGTITSVTQLGQLQGASAFMSHRAVLFYAEIAEIGTPALGEGIAEIVLVPPDGLERMILEDQITDAPTIAAAYHARLRGLF